MLYAGANEEFLKIKEVGKEPLEEFFTYLNFKQRKNELDALRIRKKI